MQDSRDKHGGKQQFKRLCAGNTFIVLASKGQQFGVTAC